MSVHESWVATRETFDLGEGVVWDDRAKLVRWVDIRAGRVLAGRLGEGEGEGEGPRPSTPRIAVVEDRAIGQTVGAVALADDSGLLLAAAHGLATVSPTGDVSVGPELIERIDAWRLNDGIVDPQGRFLVGTLSLNPSVGPAHTAEVLLRVSPDGTVEHLRTGLGLSNGLGFSPDGATIFHIDTFAGTLSRHSYAPGAFDVDEPWVTVIDNFTHFPDGMTVDAQGDLWVGLWTGAHVARYSAQGDLIERVPVAADKCTCVGFVGGDQRLLAITTARDSPSATDVGIGAGSNAGSDLGSDGCVFLAAVERRGTPEYRWAGSTSAPYWLTDSKG